jgi:hypothetical protein
MIPINLMNLIYNLTKARLCLPRRGETALRVVDLYGSETAPDFVIAHIVRGAKPSPQKRKMLK